MTSSNVVIKCVPLGKAWMVRFHCILSCGWFKMLKLLPLLLVAQSCPTPCDPMDCSPPSSPVHGIFQQEDWSGLPFPSPVVLNILKQNKQIHRVTLSLPLKFYSPYHLPGETSIYLGYLFTSFPVPKVLLPLPFFWLLPILYSHFSLSFTFSAAVLAFADLLDHINLFRSTYPAELYISLCFY